MPVTETADDVLASLPGDRPRLIGGTKGSHIIVGEFPGAPKVAIYTEAVDNRPYFIVPWAGNYLIGVPGIIHIPLALAFGMLGGFIWAAVPGLLKARFGAHEVITTIMLNYVAFQLTDFLINKGPMADKHSTAPRTPFIDPLAHLPILVGGTRLHAGLILALVAVPVVWFLLERTTIGFRIRTVGFSPGAARAAGMLTSTRKNACSGLCPNNSTCLLFFISRIPLRAWPTTTLLGTPKFGRYPHHRGRRRTRMLHGLCFSVR